MTTIIACPKKQVMCCDSNVQDGDQKWTEEKVRRIDGTLYGTAGDSVDCEKFLQWISDGRPEPKPKLSKDEFNALGLNETGLYWFDAKLHPVQHHEPFAIGTGAKAARAAVLCGKNLEKAVEIACKVDHGSNLPVQVYHVNDQKRRTRRAK